MINKMLLVSLLIGCYREPVAFRDGFGGGGIHLSFAPWEELGGVMVSRWRRGRDCNILIRKNPAGLSHHFQNIKVLLGAWDDWLIGAHDRFGR